MSGKFSRRKVLGSVSAGAFSVLQIESVAGKVKRGTYIDTISDGEKIIQRKKVPKSWDRHREKSYNILQRFKQKHMSKAGITAISLGRTEAYIGERRKMGITVLTEPGQAPDLPEEAEGLPVSKKSSNRSAICTNNSYYNTKVGGITMGGDNSGTTGFKIKDNNGETGMYTAYHLWNGYPHGKQADQCGDYIGDVDSNLLNRDMDFAVIRPSPYTNFTGGIKESTTYPISGFYTRAGLDNLKSTDERVRSLGVPTGVTKGEITDTGVLFATQPDYNNHGVELDIDVGGGDSGGPVYNLETFSGTQYAVIIGANSNGDNKYGTTSCTGCGFSGLTIDLFRTLYVGGFYNINKNFNIIPQ